MKRRYRNDMSTRMPVLFLGHGNPMYAIEDSAYGRAWAALGQSLPRPRAILSVSAHWYVDHTAVTAMSQPRTIHDFGNFPRKLFEVQRQTCLSCNSASTG